MTNIIPFEFETTTVRVIERDGEPWFVTKDVAMVLGIRNSRDAVSTLDEDERGVANADTLGGTQELSAVSESGLYALIFKSRKAEAKKFRKWVTSEVLPSIRKTGQYASRQLSPEFQAIQDLVIQADEQKKRLARVEVEQAAIKRKLFEFDGETGYMTITAFCRVNDLRLPLSKTKTLGRKAARLCRERGLKVGTIPDERFGRVNSYPVPLLEELAPIGTAEQRA